MNIHEYFEVETTEDRLYLIAAVNAANASHSIEERFQERVIAVNRKDYDTIILITGEHHGPQTTEDNAEDTRQKITTPTLVAENNLPETGSGTACDEAICDRPS